MTLASLADAKVFLHVTDPARDAEVTMLLEHASALVYEYVGSRADPSWVGLPEFDSPAPDVIQAATLRMLGHLWEHRGDDAAAGPDEKIWEAISLLLMRSRDPALA